MREEFLKAIRELMRMGGERSPESDEQFIRSRTQGQYGYEDAQRYWLGVDTGINPRNLARSALQGAAFNFGDDALGLVSPEGREDMRNRELAFRQEHPVADFAAGAAGGIGAALATRRATGSTGAALGAGSGAAVSAGARAGQPLLSGLGRLIGRGSIQGAAEGALAGVGAADDPHLRVAGGAFGAAGGAGLGAAVPVAGRLGERAASAAGRFMGGADNVAQRRVAHAVEQAGGREAVERRLAEFEQAGRGDVVMLADLDPRLQNLTDAAVNRSDAGMQHFARRWARRQQDAAGRALRDVTEAHGSRPSAEEAKKSILKLRDEWAKGPDGYGGLRNETQPNWIANPDGSVSPPWQGFRDLIENDVHRDTYRRAREQDLIALYPWEKAIAEGEVMPTPAQVHSWYKRLDDAVSRAWKQGEGNFARDLMALRDEVLEEIELRYPGYRAVNAQYHRMSDLARLVDEGERLWRTQDIDEVESVFRELAHDPERLQYFREGMATMLRNMLDNKAEYAHAVREMAQPSNNMQRKLQMVFGSEDAFEEFMRRADVESAMFGTGQRAMGNSATARRFFSGNDEFDPVTLGIDMAGGGGVTSFLRQMARRNAEAARRHTSGEVAERLSTQGADNIRGLLEALSQGGGVPNWRRSVATDPNVISALRGGLF